MLIHTQTHATCVYNHYNTRSDAPNKFITRRRRCRDCLVHTHKTTTATTIATAKPARCTRDVLIFLPSPAFMNGWYSFKYLLIWFDWSLRLWLKRGSTHIPFFAFSFGYDSFLIFFLFLIFFYSLALLMVGCWQKVCNHTKPFVYVRALQ